MKTPILGASYVAASINAATGAWSYTPNADFNGTDSFTVSVTDDDGNEETQAIGITADAPRERLVDRDDPLLPGRILPSDYVGQSRRDGSGRRVEVLRDAGRQLRTFNPEKTGSYRA